MTIARCMEDRKWLLKIQVGRECYIFIWIIIAILQMLWIHFKNPWIVQYWTVNFIVCQVYLKEAVKNDGAWGNGEMAYQVKVILEQAWVPPPKPTWKKKPDTVGHVGNFSTPTGRWNVWIGELAGSLRVRLEHGAWQKQKTVSTRQKKRTGSQMLASDLHTNIHHGMPHAYVHTHTHAHTQ